MKPENEIQWAEVTPQIHRDLIRERMMRCLRDNPPLDMAFISTPQEERLRELFWDKHVLPPDVPSGE